MAYAKAIVAALVAGLTALSQALDDNALANQEIVGAIIAFLVALAAVYAVPNKPSA